MTRWVHDRPGKGKSRRRPVAQRLDLRGEKVPGKGRTEPDGVKESAVQKAVLAYCEVHPSVAWVRRQNTGSGFLVNVPTFKKVQSIIGMIKGGIPVRSSMIPNKFNLGRFIRFSFVGCSDVIGQLKDGRFLAIECKSAAGTLKDEQREFLVLVNRNGGVAFVARSVEDCERYLPKP